MDPITYSNKIRTLADEFLAEHKLVSKLSSLGDVLIAGSYMYNIMTWKDLDLLITYKDFSKDKFFKLGEYLYSEFNPTSLKFDDRTRDADDGQPRGYSWEVVTADEWNLNIWYIDQKESKTQENVRDVIYGGLNEKKRGLIVALKLSPDYKKEYTAFDVYQAVLQDNITSVAEFRKRIFKK